MNKTILFITHNLSILKFLTSDVLVIKEGLIIERGDVINNPKSMYTKELFNKWKKD